MSDPESLRGVRVLCVGDVMLDRFVYGHVKRISPESPVPILSVSDAAVSPGGAANVARNVSALGGLCTLVSVLGEDAPAHELKAALAGIEGIRCEFVTQRDRSTIEKVRFVAQGQQILRSDYEVDAPFDSQTVQTLLATTANLARNHDVMVLSDYAKGLLTDNVVSRCIEIARDNHIPVIVDPKSANLQRYAGATVLTPNSKEVRDATGIDPTEDDALAERAGTLILSGCAVKSILITRGHRGMTLLSMSDPALHIAASAREVFDVVGAGDTVVATLALALGAKLTLADAAVLANAAAGIVVGKRGTAVVTRVELSEEMARSSFVNLQSAEEKIISRPKLAAWAEAWRKKGFKIGFTNGCFDILHIGHVSLLAFAKQNCGKLVVAINSDASVRRLKQAGRPINSCSDRSLLIASFAAVDAVVVFSEDTPLEVIRELNPEVLVKGADYVLEEIVGASHVIAQGGTVLRCELVPNRSTTSTLESLRDATGR